MERDVTKIIDIYKAKTLTLSVAIVLKGEGDS